LNGRLALPRFDLAAAGIGAAGTAFAVLFVERLGTPMGLGVLLGVAAFFAIVLAYVAVPHVAVAATIPFFAALPALKVFVHPLVGATKDLIVAAAVSAAAVLFFQRRAVRQGWVPDWFTVIVVGFLGALYLANVGGYLSGETGYGAPWFHGARLVAEPLLLLLVGFTLGDPERTLSWGAASLVASAVGVAVVGLAQQALGIDRLVEFGYDYGSEVREAFGYLRSFGTLAEPFSYAGFLLLGLAALLLWTRRGPLVYLAAPVLAVGLLVSFVRTAALIALALLGLALAQRGHLRFALLLVLAAVAAAATIFGLASQQTSTRQVQVSPNQYLTLNGRTELWEEALGGKEANWLFGRGVGATGTASQRALSTFAGAQRDDTQGGGIVDSAYLATVADVGVVGLALLLTLLLRIFVLGWRAARRGERSGWLALGLLLVMVLDALTRESLTGFPTAYIGMLVVGLAVATWRRAGRAAATLDGREPALR
jgi:O-antigen ligase